MTFGGRGGLLRAILVLGALVALTIPFWANEGVVFLAGVVLTEALFALSWNLLFGYAGLVSFGHAAFFAIGAYATGVLLKSAPGVPFLGILALALVLGALVALAVGFVALKRSAGIYFAMLTLALGEVLHISIGYVDAFGRDDGISAIPRPRIDLGPLHLDFAAGTAYYWFLLLATVACGALLWVFLNGRIGRVLRAARTDPARAAFLGVDVHRYRLLAFSVSGAVAALAGALQAPWTQIVTPDTASWVHSTQAILDTLLGGASIFWGPILGTVVYTAIGFATRTLAGLSETVIGVVLLVVVLAVPGGIAAVIAAAERRLRPAKAVRPAKAA